MDVRLTIITATPYLHTPKGWIGWLVFALFAASIVGLLYHYRALNKPWKGTGKSQGTFIRKNSLIFIALLALTPFTSLFIGIRLSPGSELPPPGLPLETVGQMAMLFSGLPWMLAGGLLGPLPAVLLGIVDGLLRALWSTHSAFTPLETGLMAVLFSVAMNQRYRTRIYRLLRQPLFSALSIWLAYPLIYLISTPFIANGPLVIQLDYAISNLLNAWLAQGIVLLTAGLLSQIAARLLPAAWGSAEPLKPSPAEQSLRARFLYSVAPLAIFLILTLMVASWVIAGNVARNLLRDQMGTIAKTVASQFPYFLQNGENLITELATDTRLIESEPAELEGLLEDVIKTRPFFSQLVLLDEKGKLLAAYPDRQLTGEQTQSNEESGIKLAISGVPLQTYTLPPSNTSSTAQVSFIAALKDPGQHVKGVLLGRADLSTNPLSQPVVNGLNELVRVHSSSSAEAEGILLDENNRIAIHPNRELIGTTYWGQTDNPLSFYGETASDGTRRLIYYQAIPGTSWHTVISVPLLASQQLALQIAGPLLAMITLVSFVSLFILNMGINNVSNSLKSLAMETDILARGNLGQPLPTDGEDEIGQLRKSFEKMRLSLKARLDELNQLLKVSQGVSSSLEWVDTMQPVLDAVLAMGASSARIILTPTLVHGISATSQEPAIFSSGAQRKDYTDLDQQILELNRQQWRRQDGPIIADKQNYANYFTLKPGQSFPASLISIALRQENQYYGALWAAYDEPHLFTDEEYRFLATLASQAAVVAGNASLFLNAEIGRQRLAAILSSSPDPILVTDQHNQIILSNPAACQLLGISPDFERNQPDEYRASVDKVINNRQLVELLQDPAAEIHSAQVNLQPGKVHLAAVSTVIAEGQWVGRVCVLHDVTHFKELDVLKSEFVSTVSHDLRTPLALMRGYATMLEMVGQLNEQQLSYVRKIVAGVESMTHLVNNLLDLGRIEAGIGLRSEMLRANEIVEQVISSLQMQSNQKKIKVKSEYTPQGADLRLEADASLLQQALQNLLENAIKFTRSEGKITIRVQEQPHRMIFEVEDNGVGISPVDQPRIFEKFYHRPLSGTASEQGSGLGLAIVRSIAERHHGQVWVESQLGKGSSFYLAIPLRQSETNK